MIFRLSSFKLSHLARYLNGATGAELWSYAKLGVGIFSGIYCLKVYVGDVVQCRGPSMEDCIEDGEYFLAEVLSVKSQRLHRNDVVACLSPSKPHMWLCKRVTAFAGDPMPMTENDRFKNQKLVPAGHVWLQGDNRENSTDSFDFGPVPYGLIQARLVFRIWPLRRAGWLSSHWFYEKPPSCSCLA